MLMQRIRLVMFALMCVTMVGFGQITIDDFERPRPDTLYATSLEAPSTITLTADTADKKEGKSS